MKRKWLVACMPIALSIRGTGLGGQTQTEDYHFSSPADAITSLRRAFRTEEIDAITRGVYSSGSEGLVSREAKREDIARAIGTPFFDWLRALFEAIEVVSVSTDLDLLDDLVRPWRPPEYRPAAAVRVLCELDPASRVAQHYSGGAYRRVHFIFVQHDGKWKWYLDPFRLWEHWSYDLSAPDIAAQSLIRAIGKKDPAAVYDMIDPAMLAGIDRDAFIGTGLKRLEAISEWERERRREQEVYRITREPVPKAPPCPFLASDPHWIGHELQIDKLADETAEVARVWRLDAKGRRRAYETFVRYDDEWYWRPKPEYDVWLTAGSVGKR